MKRCIFHIPNNIDLTGKSGSQVRPGKMLKALKNQGYEVDFVMGYGKARKESIKSIKKNIRQGIKYDFLYSESSTMPTLLTEKNHLPRYPLLDFNFLRFCKKNGIKVGLFYRDVIWKFEQYKKSVPWYYRVVTFWFYKYDLFQYNKCVDVLYLPSSRIEQYIPECKKIHKELLIPGAVLDRKYIDQRKQYFESRKKGDLNIFYVGGVSGIYDILEMIKVLQNIDYVTVTICCKAEAWEKEKDRYGPYLTNRIKIVHDSGDALYQYYKKADLAWCYFDVEQHKYMKIATPIKMLEYMSFLTPVIATKGSCAAEFIEKYDVGWSIPYNVSEFTKLIEYIYDNQDSIIKKHNNTYTCLLDNTWEKRIDKIVSDLK